MKNYFFYLGLIFILSFSCTDETMNDNQENSLNEIEFSTENYVNSRIAYQEGDIIKLGVTEESLLKSFNDYSAKLNLGPEAYSYNIENINNDHYIRFYHEDGSVSTTELVKEKKTDLSSKFPVFSLGETTCTSILCASCCGCIPQGSYCSPCAVGDCKRSTSSGGALIEF